MKQESHFYDKEIEKAFDYIFCGTGASASLLLLEMHKRNLLKQSRILLIDPEKKNKRDKTFCFWAKTNEPISINLQPIISHSWDKIALSNGEYESLFPLKYFHVSSIDLYNEVKELSLNYNWEQITAPADCVSADEISPFVLVNNKKLRANRIFDSRTPRHLKAANGETHISQSFVGWMIETENEMGPSDAFRFMDFEIAQQESTQFVYVLPFSSTKALVEVTRFGAEIISTAHAEELLREYIQSRFGNFSVSAVETGCIPMSNTEIEQTLLPGVTLIGARNYHIKPSTGYAFKNMYYHACKVADEIAENDASEKLNRTHEAAQSSRFSFYDALLLRILHHKPHEGKRIFEALLNKVPVRQILSFLDERTGILEDVAIFSKLPWMPFMRALFQHIASKTWLRPLLLTLLTLFLIALGSYPAWQSNIAYGLFLLGLIIVGIPHGAVDHLLETGKWELKHGPGFIIKYLFMCTLMGIIWYIIPGFALLVFLIYSSWHFGQADGKKFGLNRFFSFLWGSSVLIYILGTHASETLDVLNAMANISFAVAIPVWAILPWLAWSIFRKQPPLLLSVLCLMLSSQLPLIISFGIYFIGQHSLTGWQHIRSHLQLSHTRIWMHALPFHAGAWLLLLLFVLFWPASSPDNPINHWAIFFIFIACISFPHAISMNAVYRGKAFHTLNRQ